MWAKLLSTIGYKLLERIGLSIYNFFMRKIRQWQHRRKTKRDNDKKVKKYEEANTKDDARDSYSDMP